MTAAAEYGVYCDAIEYWFSFGGYVLFHTAHLGVAIAQRDVLNREWREFSRTYRVRQFPDVDQFDHAENIVTMPVHPSKRKETE